MNFRRSAIIACVLTFTFWIGAEVSAWRSGDVIVYRNSANDCLIMDMKHGTVLGTMIKYGDRCHIRDWRMWHPFF
jgi:hypothetical protein